jgi:hypothetical protein
MFISIVEIGVFVLAFVILIRVLRRFGRRGGLKETMQLVGESLTLISGQAPASRKR